MEDLEERVLYDYQKIEERHKEQWMPHPIAYFRLAPLYDRIQQKRSALLPSNELSRRGLLDGSREPTTEIERRSLTFYEHLLEYDALLEEIAVTHPTLSYLELTSGVWLERIARIFDSKQAKEGKYDRFVRSQQYTVSPYYFHLIDLYVENVLRYTPSGTEDFDGSSASLVLPPSAGDFYPGMSH